MSADASLNPGTRRQVAVSGNLRADRWSPACPSTGCINLSPRKEEEEEEKEEEEATFAGACGSGTQDHRSAGGLGSAMNLYGRGFRGAFLRGWRLLGASGADSLDVAYGRMAEDYNRFPFRYAFSGACLLIH